MRAEGRRAARREATASGTRLAVPRRCSRTRRSRSASSLSSSSTSLSSSSASSSAAGGGALRFRGLSTAPAWPGAGAAPAMVGKSARSRGEWRAKQPPERDDQATRGAELFQFGSGAVSIWERKRARAPWVSVSHRSGCLSARAGPAGGFLFPRSAPIFLHHLKFLDVE